MNENADEFMNGYSDPDTIPLRLSTDRLHERAVRKPTGE